MSMTFHSLSLKFSEFVQRLDWHAGNILSDKSEIEKGNRIKDERSSPAQKIDSLSEGPSIYGTVAIVGLTNLQRHVRGY